MSKVTNEDLQKIEPLNKLLESRFGVRIESGSFEHLVAVREHYDEKRKRFIETMGEAQALSTPEYAKCVLITEAARILLREIAPKRVRRRKK
jgi:hypothetical protein